MRITSLRPHHAVETASGFRLKPATLQEMFGMRRRHAEQRGGIEEVVVISEQNAEFGIANPHRILQHGSGRPASSSPGELEMTLSTSDVAVCWSSASVRSSVRCRNSLSSRVFSMAMTAWAAKFCTSSICLSVNGRTSWR